MKILLLFLATVIYGQVLAQTINYDELYQKAKTNLANNDYLLASKGFRTLMSNDPANPKAAYTTYYYGISTYYLDDLSKSRDIFLQLVKNFSGWDNLPEAYLWLSKLHFELDSPNQGVYYASLASRSGELSNEIEAMKRAYISQLDTATLGALISTDTEAEIAAYYLANKLVKVKIGSRNNELLDSLIRWYNLDSSQLGLAIPEDHFKERYEVAIMLPLFSERLWQSGIYLQKSLAVDIYEGIRLAAEEFDSTKLELKVYDTQMDSSVTNNILASGQLKDVDAIIGPLYPKPLELVSAYSNEHKLNFISPVSTNSQLIRHNPYCFLLRTGAESMGKRMAEFSKSRLDTGAFAVYYGTRATDSLVAYNYISQMELDSFYLITKQRTRTNDARKIFDSLTSAVQVLDTLELQRILKAEEKMPRFMPLMDSLRIKIDSIGHIFIASDNKAIASEVMAAITYRGDSTQLIGVGNWFSTANASLRIMQSLGVWLAMQEFENMLHPDNLFLSEKYRARYHKKPGKYVYFGYYAMKFLGESLLNYGVYFQNGYRDKGILSPFFDFTNSQDNQRLRVFTLKEGRPVIVAPGILPKSEE